MIVSGRFRGPAKWLRGAASSGQNNIESSINPIGLDMIV